MKTDGSVRDGCKSRVLESSLMFYLLKIQQIYPNSQYQLIQYLSAELGKEQNNKFNKALILGALGKNTSEDAQVVEYYLRGFEHFTTSRKRMLFSAILAELQVIPYDGQYQIEHFYDLGYQNWVAAEICALKVLYAFGLNQPQWVNRDDVEFLLATQNNESIWEKHVLCNIIILLALQKFPEHHHVILKGINNLLSCQNSDGGFPFIASFEIFCTATNGIALIDTGVEIETLLQMAQYIAGQQQSDGGWSYAEGTRQTDVDDTSFCVEFLQAVEPNKYKEYISKAQAYLLAIQNEDGGFPTFVRGNPSEITMTAAALNALAPWAADYTNVFELGLRYITSQQKLDGSFERSWSLSEAQAIFRSVLAIRSCKVIQSPQLLESIYTAEAKALNYLLRSQNSDGGWGHQLGEASDVISTSYTLIALSTLGDTETLRRGAGYLILQQDKQGKFISIPDQAAPRPIPYDVPILTSIFALIALKYMAAVITE
ncbi:MAG: prenyltransferase/squalene oxidase repeat-containing protein [Nostoc sp. CmiVER01]|uniref:prenyltransferase/squalene oxidase repeat-containing protein n=1 Tax=Nostoc sp. CmiVER01 TaxID=3075384 RepID=UPI002AD202D5|nr:prenyltransferase/squalene oxidase repeat-containing protein [Nostoc sp. CmiVER01]MDZ8126752.1 terpene cyclase/mutase family protein [Nostoc sp. CmiVER01]